MVNQIIASTGLGHRLIKGQLVARPSPIRKVVVDVASGPGLAVLVLGVNDPASALASESNRFESPAQLGPPPITVPMAVDDLAAPTTGPASPRGLEARRDQGGREDELERNLRNLLPELVALDVSLRQLSSLCRTPAKA